MGCLDITHPEIKDFITCKNIEGELSNFNISVKLTDEFLKNPDPIIMSSIIDGIYKNGEPGILFKDTIEKFNPTPEFGELNPNPCIHKNSYMFTPNGLEKISSSPLHIFDGEKFIKSKIWKNSIKSTVKITTSSGFEFITTPDHMFMLSNGHWCEAEDLYNKNINFDVSDKTWIGNNPHPTMNYEVVGFIFGDGSYHKASKRVKYVYVTPYKDDEVETILTSELKSQSYLTSCHKIINIPLDSLYTQLFTETILTRMIPEWIMTLPKSKMRIIFTRFV